MEAKSQESLAVRKCSHLLQYFLSRSTSKGQALVEFTLVFILLLVVAWIPADFGLALYSGQIAQNAAREGARIAAADATLIQGTDATCGPPLSSCYSFGNIFNETSARLPAALLKNTSIRLVVEDDPSNTNCNQLVTVTVSGTYNFFFYQLLRLIGINTPDSQTINRFTSMRWEHQPGC